MICFNDKQEIYIKCETEKQYVSMNYMQTILINVQTFDMLSYLLSQGLFVNFVYIKMDNDVLKIGCFEKTHSWSGSSGKNLKFNNMFGELINDALMIDKIKYEKQNIGLCEYIVDNFNKNINNIFVKRALSLLFELPISEYYTQLMELVIDASNYLNILLFHLDAFIFVKQLYHFLHFTKYNKKNNSMQNEKLVEMLNNYENNIETCMTKSLIKLFEEFNK